MADSLTIEPVRLVLASLWIALMLTYLLGDVLRIFAGDFTPGQMDGEPAAPWMWTMAAGVMLVPIVMVVASLLVPYPAIRWTTIVLSVGLVLFNIAGLPYDGLYDNVLIIVGFIWNAMLVWFAWSW